MKRSIVAFGAGVLLALVLGVAFVKAGPFYRYYTAAEFFEAGDSSKELTAIQAGIFTRQSALLARGCEPLGTPSLKDPTSLTVRCPFWITP